MLEEWLVLCKLVYLMLRTADLGIIIMPLFPGSVSLLGQDYFTKEKFNC